MEIKLQIDGKEKTFTQDFVSGRMVREALVIAHKVGEKANPTPEELDEMIDFCTKVYAGQFTRDQFYDGIRAQDLLPTVMTTITGIMGK